MHASQLLVVHDCGRESHDAVAATSEAIEKGSWRGDGVSIAVCYCSKVIDNGSGSRLETWKVGVLPSVREILGEKLGRVQISWPFTPEHTLSLSTQTASAYAFSKETCTLLILYE